MTSFDQPSDESEADGPARTVWFEDESSVLLELKRIRAAEMPPPAIRGYAGFREVQRGGQGIVYQAVQQSTNRVVAVKVLLDRFGAIHAVRKRFEREIDMIASLRHPNIVRVYDSGVAIDGRLYLVMDYIEGVPLDEFDRGSERKPREVVTLFLTICRAVSYAHQRGIIHRDLKPSNIRIDDGGHPHVLDFGLAKVTGQDGAPVPRSSISISGQILGSIPWASPEQADGRTNDVDVRSDIYAIGVMLYHALTGQMPYDVAGSMRDALMNILETEPARPSAIRPGIDRDLETITLKALAKNPARRYQSVQALADDLAHWLAGEPIEARRDSAWYLVTKTARKHRPLVLTGVLGIAALITFTATLAVLYQRAVAGEHLAEQRLVQAEREAQRSDEERRRAERRFDDVRTLANRFMFDIHDQIEPLAGSRPAREALVTTALEYLSSLAEESGDDPDLQLEIAAAYRRIGNIQGSPFHANLGDSTGALASYETALGIQQAVLDEHDEDAELQREIVDLTSYIGDMHQWMGQRGLALEHYDRAHTLLQPLRESDPENRNIRRLIAALHIKRGDTLQWLNDPDGVLREYRAGLVWLAELAEEPENSRDLLNHATAHSKVGFALGYNLGRHDEAVEHHSRALKITESIAQVEPENAQALRAVSINANQVGATLVALGRYGEAETVYERSLAIAQQLYDVDPGNALATSDLAFTHNKVGELHLAIHSNHDALEHFVAALEARRRIAERDRENANFQRDLATSHGLVAQAHVALALVDRAAAEHRRAHLVLASEHYRNAGQIMLTLRDRNLLGAVDADRPEFYASEIDRIATMLDE